MSPPAALPFSSAAKIDRLSLKVFRLIDFGAFLSQFGLELAGENRSLTQEPFVATLTQQNFFK
jgi:hypothetical protein